MGSAAPFLSMGGSILGGLMQAGGQMQQARAAAQAAKYQAQVAENNRAIANVAATDALARGTKAEQMHRLRVRHLISRQRSDFAARGVLVDSGSAGQTEFDTGLVGEIDAMTIRDNAMREAFGHRAQAGNFAAERDLARFSAKNAITAGNTAAMGSLIGAGTSVASKWYEYGREGVFGGTTSSSSSSAGFGRPPVYGVF